MPDLPEKAISIRQPWAWAILNAGKDIENRDWRTDFRGPVCLHASRQMTADDFGEAAMFFRTMGIEAPVKAQLLRGGIVGTAEIVDCVAASESRWFFGEFGFVLANVAPTRFIECRGALGFFRWETGVTFKF